MSFLIIKNRVTYLLLPLDSIGYGAVIVVVVVAVVVVVGKLI